VTADEIADPQNLKHHTHEQRAGDAEVSTPADMAHQIPRCIEWGELDPHASSRAIFWPPAPNHRGLNSFMDGDKIELTVEKVGTPALQT